MSLKFIYICCEGITTTTPLAKKSIIPGRWSDDPLRSGFASFFVMVFHKKPDGKCATRDPTNVFRIGYAVRVALYLP